jgi:enamine deaminase RidA (YjgF/YER057c/UK114 family)
MRRRVSAARWCSLPADYAALIESWNRFFTENAPPRTTVAVHQLPDPDLRIELKAIAHRAAST